MMAGFHRWWRLRTRREQRLLLIAAALASFLSLWLAILRPLSGALADARARHDRAVRAWADVRAEAATVGRLQRVRSPALPAPLQVHLGALAADAGFAIARIEPMNSRQANLVINAARAPALFAWVVELERRHGLVVHRLSARANSDATIAVEVAFRARGR